MPETKESKYERALELARGPEGECKVVFDLLTAAHNEGDARATYALATWFLHGSLFTPINKKKAVALLKVAAKAGNADAAFDLAVSYEIGEGIAKSLKLAFEMHVRAALLGHAQSFYEVGRMYFHGIGTSRNRRLADYWLEKGESLGATDRKK